MADLIENEPCYIYHVRDYQEHSQIVEALSLNYGALTIMAKGSKRANSHTKGIFQPFIPLKLSLKKSRSDLYFLTGYEDAGSGFDFKMPYYFCASYINELLHHLYHNKDSDVALFGSYIETLEAIRDKQAIESHLRHFELTLLRSLGYSLSNFDDEGALLSFKDKYRFCFGLGFVKYDEKLLKLVLPQNRKSSSFNASSYAYNNEVSEDSDDGMLFSKSKVRGRRLESNVSNSSYGSSHMGFENFHNFSQDKAELLQKYSDYMQDFLGPILNGAQIRDILDMSFALPDAARNAKLLTSSIINKLLQGREIKSRRLYREYVELKIKQKEQSQSQSSTSDQSKDSALEPPLNTNLSVQDYMSKGNYDSAVVPNNVNTPEAYLNYALQSRVQANDSFMADTMNQAVSKPLDNHNFVVANTPYKRYVAQFAIKAEQASNDFEDIPNFAAVSESHLVSDSNHEALINSVIDPKESTAKLETSYQNEASNLSDFNLDKAAIAQSIEKHPLDNEYALYCESNIGTKSNNLPAPISCSTTNNALNDEPHEQNSKDTKTVPNEQSHKDEEDKSKSKLEAKPKAKSNAKAKDKSHDIAQNKQDEAQASNEPAPNEQSHKDDEDKSKSKLEAKPEVKSKAKDNSNDLAQDKKDEAQASNEQSSKDTKTVSNEQSHKVDEGKSKSKLEVKSKAKGNAKDKGHNLAQDKQDDAQASNEPVPNEQSSQDTKTVSHEQSHKVEEDKSKSKLDAKPKAKGNAKAKDNGHDLVQDKQDEAQAFNEQNSKDTKTVSNEQSHKAEEDKSQSKVEAKPKAKSNAKAKDKGHDLVQDKQDEAQASNELALSEQSSKDTKIVSNEQSHKVDEDKSKSQLEANPKAKGKAKSNAKAKDKGNDLVQDKQDEAQASNELASNEQSSKDTKIVSNEQSHKVDEDKSKAKLEAKPKAKGKAKSNAKAKDKGHDLVQDKQDEAQASNELASKEQSSKDTKTVSNEQSHKVDEDKSKSKLEAKPEVNGRAKSKLKSKDSSTTKAKESNNSSSDKPIKRSLAKGKIKGPNGLLVAESADDLLVGKSKNQALLAGPKSSKTKAKAKSKRNSKVEDDKQEPKAGVLLESWLFDVTSNK